MGFTTWLQERTWPLAQTGQSHLHLLKEEGWCFSTVDSDFGPFLPHPGVLSMPFLNSRTLQNMTTQEQFPQERNSKPLSPESPQLTIAGTWWVHLLYQLKSGQSSPCGVSAHLALLDRPESVPIQQHSCFVWIIHQFLLHDTPKHTAGVISLCCN